MQSLSSRYQSRIDKSKTGTFKTKKGTTVTQATVDAIRNDEIGNLIIVENNSVVIANAIERAVTTALEEIGLVAEGAAKRLCPVDTGRLRNSITHAFVHERMVAIGTNVEYAPYVHNGTRFWNGQGPRKAPKGGYQFLVRAAQNNVDRFGSILRKHMQNG